MVTKHLPEYLGRKTHAPVAFHPCICAHTRLQVHISSTLHYLMATTCAWWMLVFTDQYADAFFPATVCNMFSNSFALFSIWPQRWGIMVLTLHPAHILYRLSLNTVSLLAERNKSESIPSGLKLSTQRVAIQLEGKLNFLKKKEVWPNFNPCHFHFSYPVDLGDFIYTVSLSLGIGNQAFMEIIKSTYSTLKVELTDTCC